MTSPSEQAGLEAVIAETLAGHCHVDFRYGRWSCECGNSLPDPFKKTGDYSRIAHQAEAVAATVRPFLAGAWDEGYIEGDASRWDKTRGDLNPYRDPNPPAPPVELERGYCCDICRRHDGE